MKNTFQRGYTLIELIVAVGLFAIIMTLATGAYLVMINANRHVQATAAGIDNLAFALETMTRTIRTGSLYSCGADVSNGTGSDCSGGTILYVTSPTGVRTSYTLSGTTITQTQNNVSSSLTDPSVTVSSLMFYANGTKSGGGDTVQSRVTIIVSGTVSSGPGKTLPFTVETGATMRGIDL